MKALSNKFIIFAHSRSGSTNLGLVLRQHPVVSIAGEPFNKNYSSNNPSEKNYIDFVHDTTSLDEQLDDLYKKYTGLKVLSHQLPEKLNEYLLKNAEIKVIFLRRKNLLQTVISQKIATETKIWYKKINSDSPLKELKQLEPIDIEKTKIHLDKLSNDLNNYQHIIESQRGSQFLKLYYEDFYTPIDENNRRNAKAVFDFLGLEIPQSKMIEQFMNPKKAKMNSADTYELIPNIRDVENELGSDQSGWLFK